MSVGRYELKNNIIGLLEPLGEVVFLSPTQVAKHQ